MFFKRFSAKKEIVVVVWLRGVVQEECQKTSCVKGKHIMAKEMAEMKSDGLLERWKQFVFIQKRFGDFLLLCEASEAA